MSDDEHGEVMPDEEFLDRFGDLMADDELTMMAIRRGLHAETCGERWRDVWTGDAYPPDRSGQLACQWLLARLLEEGGTP